MGRQRDRNRMAAVMASARERGFEPVGLAYAARSGPQYPGLSDPTTAPRTHPPRHTVLAPRPGCSCEGCEAARGRR